MNSSPASPSLLTANPDLIDRSLNPEPISAVAQETDSTVELISDEGGGAFQEVIDLPRSFQCELKIFASTFLTIFLAELGDKTQFTILLMSAESQSPWVVFVGAGAALVLTSLLGILLGRWLATKIAPSTLDTAAGISLLLISMMLFCDILRG